MFYDHDETGQRELRILLLDDRGFLFYKTGVFLCDQYMNHRMNCTY